MRRVVQIRGTTGAGKTSAMRGAIALAGGGETHQVDGLKQRRPITVTPQFTALGDYNAKAACVGCDRFSNRNDLMAVLKSTLDKQPERIALEGMIYSHTFKLASDMNQLCKQRGYEFVAVFLDVDYETALTRIFERNGAKPINYDTLVDKVLAFNVSMQKIIRAGISHVVLDAAHMSKEEVAKEVYKVITQ